MKNNIVYFQSIYKDHPNIFTSSKNRLPDWYKKTRSFVGGSPQIDNLHLKTFKPCIPFLDAMTSGYMILLPCDIYVGQTELGPIVKWNMEDAVIVKERDPSINKSLPTPPGCHDSHFVWMLPVSISIPKKHSMLITHPFNRFDLPFVTTSGIVDGDNFSLYGNGSIPFFISKDFNGIIPAGTPIAQVFPFKRKKWRSKIDKNLNTKADYYRRLSSARFINWYKENCWIKKIYD